MCQIAPVLLLTCLFLHHRWLYPLLPSSLWLFISLDVVMGSGASVSEVSQPERLEAGVEPEPDPPRASTPAGQSDDTVQVNILMHA